MTDKHAREKEKKGEKASCKKEGAAYAPVKAGQYKVTYEEHQIYLLLTFTLLI